MLKDAGLSHEFRVAMLRLCQERLGRGDVSVAERETVIGWLRGERIPAGELRKLSLHAKVARHNARSLLLSSTRWLRMAGHAGLVLQMDLTRLAVSRRPPAGLRDGYYYSKAGSRPPADQPLLDPGPNRRAAGGCGMTTMAVGAGPAVAGRRAIEALRAGVPSRDAVAATGSGQAAIEDRFTSLLRAVPAGNPAGLLLGGRFGSGKSHLLKHLARLALDAGFTVSRVVISKETPLHDTAKVFAAAAESAVMAGRPRPAMTGRCSS